MSPALQHRLYPTPKPEPRLCFRPLSLDDIPAIRPLLARSGSRTNDFTVGGIMMWADYFHYTFSIVDNTLFIKGVAEDDVTTPAFSLPVGDMPPERAVAMLRNYCSLNGLTPKLSAVPADKITMLQALGATAVEPLDDWADYLYDAGSLSTLAGKKMNKKRNHVNRFKADNAGYRFDPLDGSNIARVKEFARRLTLDDSKDAIARYELDSVIGVLDNIGRYPFEGAVLSTPADGIVAFTIGEVMGDTLFVHIEKINHLVAGAGEMINMSFASMMTARHPSVAYINREEDVGDPGLRRAKQSYHPAALLTKFNVTL